MSQQKAVGWAARISSMRKRAKAIGLSVLLLAASSLPMATAHGASNEGQYAVKGPGLATCQRYVDARDNGGTEYASALGWVAGYISAYNRFTDDTLDVAPWQSLELLGFLLDQYCKRNPELQFVRAMDAAIVALQPTRLRASSDSVTAEHNGQRVLLYREVLRRAQQLLLERGHYDGAIDGLWGSATREAFERFQEAQQIPVTGLPDQRTLLQVFR